MRLLKLKHGSRVPGRSSGAARPSVDSGAVFASRCPSQNFLEILESSAGCALLVFGLIPSTSYADPLTFTINDEEVKKLYGETAFAELNHQISWEKGYRLNVDEATGIPYDSGWTGRNSHQGDKAELSNGWTLIFPLISRAQAISLEPTQNLSAVSIAGKGQGNSLVIQGQDKSNHRGIYLYYSKSISDKDWESNPPKVNIDNVDLKITNVRYGVYQYSPSIVEISNEKTVIDCSTYAGSQALYAVSMFSSGELKPFSISIESGHIEVTVAPKGTSYSSSGIIYQRMQTGSSVISLNLKREGVTLFKGIKNESFYTFDMDGEQVTTNIGGQMLHLQNEGSVTPTQVYYITAKGKAPAVTQLRGGHTAAIFDGAHLNLFSKNI